MIRVQTVCCAPQHDKGAATRKGVRETSAGRGHGHLRLRGGQCWTLLTTLAELKGYEEPKGLRRPMGAKHGANRDRTSWLEDREYEARELGVTEQPRIMHQFQIPLYDQMRERDKDFYDRLEKAGFDHDWATTAPGCS